MPYIWPIALHEPGDTAQGLPTDHPTVAGPRRRRPTLLLAPNRLHPGGDPDVTQRRRPTPAAIPSDGANAAADHPTAPRSHPTSPFYDPTAPEISPLRGVEGGGEEGRGGGGAGGKGKEEGEERAISSSGENFGGFLSTTQRRPPNGAAAATLDWHIRLPDA